MLKNIFLCGKCPLIVEKISVRESTGFAPLGREVTGEVEDKLRGVGGESVYVSVGSGHDSHVGGDGAVVGVSALVGGKRVCSNRQCVGGVGGSTVAQHQSRYCAS
jgi:hypothetical protein